MEEIQKPPSTLHRYLFTVTTLSKLLAMFLFIILPFAGFYAGIKYQQKITFVAPVASDNKITNLHPTPTPSVDTSRWITYTGSDNFLTFKYPSNFHIKDHEYFGHRLVIVYDQDSNVGPGSFYLNINYEQFSPSYSALLKEHEFNKENLRILPDGFISVLKDENSNIVQVDKYSKYKDGAFRSYYRNKPGIPSEIYNQILSTLKFTN